MKHLLTAILAALFVISPAFAERDDDERGERRERRERREHRERDEDDERGERRGRRERDEDDEREERRGRRERDEDDERYERRKRMKERKMQDRHKRGQWKILQSISAEERERLRQLHATNPEAFKKEIAKIVKRIRTEKQKLNKKIKNLVSQYKNAEDDKTKKAAMEQLRKITRDIFLEKMQKNKKRLESLEKHVKKLRQQYEFRQKNAEKIIQRRLDTLTNDAKFDW